MEANPTWVILGQQHDRNHMIEKTIHSLSGKAELSATQSKVDMTSESL